MAGPDRPPNPLPRRGLRVCASMARATNVLTSEMASAPASAAARARGSILETLGESLTMSGLRAARRAARDDFSEQRRIVREIDPAVRCVGAGNVEFVSADSFGILKGPQDLRVILDRIAENIRDDGRSAEPATRAVSRQ